MFLYQIFSIASKLLSIISAAIFIYCILTWVAPRSPARYWLERFVEPFCMPFRALARIMIVRWGCPFDLTCWLAMIGISLIERLLWYFYSFLIRLF